MSRRDLETMELRQVTVNSIIISLVFILAMFTIIGLTNQRDVNASKQRMDEVSQAYEGEFENLILVNVNDDLVGIYQPDQKPVYFEQDFDYTGPRIRTTLQELDQYDITLDDEITSYLNEHQIDENSLLLIYKRK